MLPPLEPLLYVSLLRIAVAVLDPFPVGLHVPILDALQESVPVVSECLSPTKPWFLMQCLQVTAPALQECGSQFAYGLLRSLGLGAVTAEDIPVTPEEYAVFALRLQQDTGLRYRYHWGHEVESDSTHGSQLATLIHRWHGRNASEML